MNILPVIESSGVSVVGLVREDNQDAILIHENSHSSEIGHLFAIADGMGGYACGSVASNMALEAMARALFESKSNTLSALRMGIEKANVGVYNTAQKMGVGRMGTTLTAAYLRHNTMFIAHVGDSRAYLIRQKRATCLTNDHTTVGEMVRAKLISAGKIRTHANRSLLTRAIGVNLFVQPEISKHNLLVGDRILLCSDGVWSVIEDSEFAEISSENSVEETSHALVDLALQRDSDDNASVVVFQINAYIDSTESVGVKNSNWFYKLRNFSR